jgi:hypothetical protein
MFIECLRSQLTIIGIAIFSKYSVTWNEQTQPVDLTQCTVKNFVFAVYASNCVAAVQRCI